MPKIVNNSFSFPSRRSIRLKEYDYTQEGLYFLTICCNDRVCLFGNIVNGEMVLNDAGKIAEQCWLEIPDHFTNVVLHEFVIMPNHVHGIVEFVGANHHSPENANHHSVKNTNENVGNNKLLNVNLQNQKIEPKNNIRTNNDSQQIRANSDSPLRKPMGTSKTVGSVVRGFKIGVTKWARANTHVHTVWQRNYWENIIRDEQSYEKISGYIKNNPEKWSQDKFHVPK